MRQLGFEHTDRLFQLVRDAEFALRDLVMAIHYLSCEGGDGRPPGEETE